ncbi:conserved hypothetical protein [Actinacidiphila bryophytorum]|uniref:vWA-MoxR associated protein C-terminal domain-containing protein n=2 Tax=Actinacidiphila bryophytorum TaxID=1436133 RepID=A0A9W4GVT3_9ACTN|nr:conserved hypothetical protein [Actinacidiphila bryophytorum]
MGERDPDAAVQAAWVVVRPAGGAPAGAGVVVGDGIVLTCAHVVNAALGRDRFAAEEPSDADLAGLTLTLPAHGTGAETYRPTLLSWTPARPSARPGRWEGDLALLRLPEGAPRPTPVRFADAAMGSTAWVWYASGDGRTAVDVLVQKPLGPWLLLDPGSSEVPVRHGYSGSPLWDSASGAAVGLMVSVEPEVRRYYALAPAAVREALAAAGLAAAGPRDPRQEWLHQQAAEALAALPEERFRRGANRLAWSLGLSRPPARPEDAADAALAHPRGLPALRDAFTEPAARPAAGEPGYTEARLAAVVARACPVRLLGPEDHARLAGLLAGVPLPELLAAARAAVPYLPLHSERVPDTAALLDCLENRTAEPGVMPPLLQVAEEVAALRAGVREELRELDDRVAARLRVLPGALDQVRADAKARAGSRAAGRPVVRVWLWDRGKGDAFCYVIRLYDGDDQPLSTWSAVDTPRGHEELCGQLAEAVRMLAEHGDNAGVEFLLEHGSFGLPFDRWPIPVPDLGPRLLGMDHVVVLRGQRQPSRGPWERRWGCAGSAASVVQDVDHADDLLGEDRDAALVIAACAPGEIDPMVRLCRHYGVPVMLWHRQGAGDGTTGALLELTGGDWRRDLREAVRRQRFTARKDDRMLGAHLALLWEDPRWDPRTAGLAEPAPLP